MKKFFNNLVILISFIAPCISYALEIQYETQTELHGVLKEGNGIDCCFKGEERSIKYPLISLEKPVDVISVNLFNKDNTDPTEKNITSIHLALNDKNLKTFKRLKGKKVRLQCIPYHSYNGHHMTPVMCEVKSISNF